MNKEEMTKTHRKMFEMLKELSQEQISFISYFASLAVNNSLSSLLKKYDRKLPKDFVEEADDEIKEVMQVMEITGTEILGRKEGNKA